MGVTARLAVLVGVLLIPALVLVRWALTVDASVDLARPVLPERVGAWTSTREATLDANMLALIEPDAYAMHLYEADGRTPIWIYVGIYAGRAGTGKSAHVPEACYPAQGWEPLSSESIQLRLAGDEMLALQKLEFHRMAAREKVLYWFQPARRWPTGGAAEQLLRVADAVGGRPQYAFVRISTRSRGPAAAQDLEAFAAGIAPSLREIVGGVR